MYASAYMENSAYSPAVPFHSSRLHRKLLPKHLLKKKYDLSSKHFQDFPRFLPPPPKSHLQYLTTCRKPSGESLLDAFRLTGSRSLG